MPTTSIRCVGRRLAAMLNTARYLLEHGADIHADDDFPLRGAAEGGQLDTVRYLLEQGRIFMLTDREWALCSAAANWRLQTAQCLMEFGADWSKVGRSEERLKKYQQNNC